MKKSTLKKNRISKRSKLAIAGTATMAALPMLGNPAIAVAQQTGTTATIQDNAAIKHGPYLKYADKFIKRTGQYSIAGVDGEHIVYRNSGGEYFFVDPATGDMRFISTVEFHKYALKTNDATGSYIRKKLPGKMKSGQITVSRAAPETMEWKFSDEWLKDHREDGGVKILGVDAAGHDVLQTNSGETVYLNPRTGDFIPVR